MERSKEYWAEKFKSKGIATEKSEAFQELWHRAQKAAPDPKPQYVPPVKITAPAIPKLEIPKTHSIPALPNPVSEAKSVIKRLPKPALPKIGIEAHRAKQASKVAAKVKSSGYQEASKILNRISGNKQLSTRTAARLNPPRSVKKFRSGRALAFTAAGLVAGAVAHNALKAATPNPSKSFKTPEGFKMVFGKLRRLKGS